MSVLFVVPTLGRRADLLVQALDSVHSQERRDLDLVVVAPPGSHAESAAAAAGARFLADPGRGGLPGALNAALDDAPPSTRYFAWLGDDDLLAPGSLDATVAALDAAADAVLVYGWCDYIDEHNRVVFRSRAGRLAKAIMRVGPNLIPQPGSLMRYDAVRAVGGLDETVHLAPDLDLYLRLRRRGRILCVPRTLACFRWHPDSATVTHERLSMREADRVRMKYLSRPSAAAYRVLHWPGHGLLRLAKRGVARNVARPAAGR